MQKEAKEMVKEDLEAFIGKKMDVCLGLASLMNVTLESVNEQTAVFINRSEGQENLPLSLIESVSPID